MTSSVQSQGRPPTPGRPPTGSHRTQGLSRARWDVLLGPGKSVIRIIIHVFQHFNVSFFFFFFGLHCTPAVEALSPNHRTSRKFPISVSFLNLANCYRPFFTQACKHINNFISLCLVASVASDSLQPYGLDCQAPLSTEFSRQEYWKG